MKIHIKVLVTFCSIVFFNTINAQPELRFLENISPSWQEVIEIYKSLDNKYPEARLIEAGISDAGKPIHLFIISKDKVFTADEIHALKKTIILINNGIHPGESNGIDASIDFAQELLTGDTKMDTYLENTVILIVPIFNIGGALNRSPYNRANQNGPEEQGFRGNACNMDLNRDFVKMDSKNAISMAKIIQEWNPDIFIDTHSTNGADYPYTLTLISSHHQQMEEPQSSFIHKKMEPALFEAMNNSPYKMCPYVNIFRKSPENGFEGFYEYPRYLAGYTSTFQILSFTIETHMLKPYSERVLGTKYLLGEFLKFAHENGIEIRESKEKAILATIARKEFALQWYNDTSQYDIIPFNGYKAKTKTSEVTKLEMIYYDKNDPWSDNIRFYNYFKPSVQVYAPEYYVLPAAWSEVVNRLKWNNIEMAKLEKDTSFLVEAYYIEDYQTTSSPYNGHYLHFATEIRKEKQTIKFQEGDYLIPLQQRGAAYIVSTLEPQGYDSYFNWNFFDEILMRMEYFSPYLFDEIALSILNSNPELKKSFQKLKEEDVSFANSTYAQLNWIYERSEWSEKSYRRYPVYRIN